MDRDENIPVVLHHLFVPVKCCHYEINTQDQCHLAIIPGLGESSLLGFDEKLEFRANWGDGGGVWRWRGETWQGEIKEFLDQVVLLLYWTRNCQLLLLSPAGWFPNLTQIKLEGGGHQKLLEATSGCQGTPLVHDVPERLLVTLVALLSSI